MSNTPDNLHRMQYAVHILEEVLCWPSKGNAELVADCLLALSKGKKLSDKQAHDYMVRAISLAKEQSFEINRFWFQGGEYTLMRPTHRESKAEVSPISMTEGEIALMEAYSKCLKCRGLDTRPEAVCNCPKTSKETLKAQAAEILAKRSPNHPKST